MAKNKNKKRKQSLINQKVVFLAILIIISLVLIAVNTIPQLILEKKFSKIENTLTTVTEKELPDHKIEKRCYRASRKFSEGPLYCYIAIKPQSPVAKSELEENLQKLRDSGEWIDIKEPGIDKVPYSEGSYKHKKTGFKCRLIVHKDLNYTETNKAYEYELSCLKESKKDVFK